MIARFFKIKFPDFPRFPKRFSHHLQYCTARSKFQIFSIYGDEKKKKIRFVISLEHFKPTHKHTFKAFVTCIDFVNHLKENQILTVVLNSRWSQFY